jgi:putative hydrolase of the HAD superfamily
LLIAVIPFRNIRAIVFDAVGTLIHPSPPAGYVYAQVGRRFGSRLDVPDIAERFKAAFRAEEERDRLNGYRTSEEREIERWRHIVATVLDDAGDGETLFHELFDHFAHPESWLVDPDAPEVIKRLASRGLRLAIASNYDRRLHSVIAGMPGLGLLQHRIISSEVGWRKPVPEFFMVVTRATNAQPQEILFVGDDLENDYRGALAAGMQALLFDPHRRVRSPDIQTLRSLKDLPAILA